MEKTAVFGQAGPVAGAPYSPGVKVGNFVFISGQLGLDPETKKPYEDFEKQTEAVLNNLRALVEASGATMADVAKTTVFLTDMANFAALNTIYTRHFDVPVKPARSTYQVAALPLGAQVEIEAIVVLPSA